MLQRLARQIEDQNKKYRTQVEIAMGPAPRDLKTGVQYPTQSAVGTHSKPGSAIAHREHQPMADWKFWTTEDE